MGENVQGEEEKENRRETKKEKKGEGRKRERGFIYGRNTFLI